MNIKRIAAVAIAVLVGSMLFIGCGSSSDDQSGTDGSTTKVVVTTNSDLTKAELIKDGDAICKETDKSQEVGLKAYLKKNPKGQSNEAEQAKMVLAVGLPPIQEEVEELAELGSPPGDEETVQAILSGIEKAIADGEKKPTSLLGEENNPFTTVSKLAAEYGFKECNNAL
jgi:hypothetical protein